MKIVSIVFCFFFLSMSVHVNAQVKKVLADKIVGTVGDKFILRSDIENTMLDMKRQAQGEENIVLPNSCQIVEQQLIRKALVLQAEKDSLLVTEEEVEEVTPVTPTVRPTMGPSAYTPQAVSPIRPYTLQPGEQGVGSLADVLQLQNYPNIV